jgi:hypothetical protein
LYTFLLSPHACSMLLPSHPPWFDHPNNVWWSVRILEDMNLTVLKLQTFFLLRCIQKFPDWVITKYTLTTINTCWEATRRFMAAKLTRLTHKIAMQLHLVAESYTICSSRSRRPVRKLLDTPYVTSFVLLPTWRPIFDPRHGD